MSRNVSNPFFRCKLKAAKEAHELKQKCFYTGREVFEDLIWDTIRAWGRAIGEARQACVKSRPREQREDAALWGATLLKLEGVRGFPSRPRRVARCGSRDFRSGQIFVVELDALADAGWISGDATRRVL